MYMYSMLHVRVMIVDLLANTCRVSCFQCTVKNKKQINVLKLLMTDEIHVTQLSEIFMFLIIIYLCPLPALL